MTAAIRTERRDTFKIDLSGAFIRRTDLSNANLKGANLSGADCANVNFRGANLQDAILDGTNLRGADLTGARNLTRSQLQRAIIDDQTILPAEFAE
ncbi:MAG: pentapeptide repeat-containing protein [Methylocystis sp.]